MKKSVFLFALAALFCLNASAQRNQMTAEQREQFMAQRIEKQAENMAQEIGVKDEARAQFIATYTEYQKVLAAVSESKNQEGPQMGQRNREKKELTAEEATQQVEKEFARQEEQITQMQQRLIVNRAYYAEFQKTLTPQQLAKIFGQRSMRGFGGQFGSQGGQRQRSGQGGNFGGGQGGNFGGGQGGFPEGGFSE